jgi:hypothetical protein
MNSKIKKIKNLIDLDDLNQIEASIEVLYIKNIDIYLDDKNLKNLQILENYFKIESYFKNVHFPFFLKEIIICNIQFKNNTQNKFEVMCWKKKLFKEMIKNIKLPYNCKLHIRIIFGDYIYFYSSYFPNKINNFKIEKNNIEIKRKQKEYFKQIKNYYNCNFFDYILNILN